MTITVDLATRVGQVRLELGDTDTTAGAGVKPDGTNLSDAELQYWLDRAGRATTDPDALIMLAVMFACQKLARDWGRAADIETPTRRESLSQVAKAWAARAAEIDMQWSPALRIRPLTRPTAMGGSEWGR